MCHGVIDSSVMNVNSKYQKYSRMIEQDMDLQEVLRHRVN